LTIGNRFHSGRGRTSHQLPLLALVADRAAWSMDEACELGASQPMSSSTATSVTVDSAAALHRGVNDSERLWIIAAPLA
jgi:hypothetical protein